MRESGPIPGTVGETWGAVAQALIVGGRGLREPSSLARLLAHHRGARNRMDVPPLSEAMILGWADAHRERMGR
jgi:hypothetical protein